MIFKKYFIIFCLLLIAPVCQIFAETDTSNNQPESQLTDIQNKIQNDAPKEINNFWKNTGAPFCENIYNIIDSWLAKNMPAARNEFITEIQSMPSELWACIQEAWQWLIGSRDSLPNPNN